MLHPVKSHSSRQTLPAHPQHLRHSKAKQSNPPALSRSSLAFPPASERLLLLLLGLVKQAPLPPLPSAACLMIG